MKTTIDEIHKLTIQKYGKLDMLNKAIQEMNECSEAIRDFKNGMKNNFNLMEELQDVKNMIRKVELIAGFDSKECKEIQINKMIRTYERLNN